jgi:hypothetical protein
MADDVHSISSADVGILPNTKRNFVGSGGPARKTLASKR